MKKDNMRIKDNITFNEHRNMIDAIVDANFIDDEYTPYYSRRGETIAIALNCLDGVEFEKGDIIIELYDEDEEFRQLIDTVRADSMHMYGMEFVKYNAMLMVEHKKEVLAHKNEALDKFIEFFDVVTGALENFAKMSVDKIDPENLPAIMELMSKLGSGEITSDTITESIKEAVGFDVDKASAEIIDAKNEQIVQLREENKKLADALSVLKDGEEDETERD